MDYDKTYELWVGKYRTEADGSPSLEDKIGVEISLMSFPVGESLGKCMIYEDEVLTQIKLSDDLIPGVLGEREYRSLVRIEVSPRVDVSEELLELLDKYDFEKIC